MDYLCSHGVTTMSETQTLIVNNLELIGQRLDLIVDSVDALIKRVEMLEIDSPVGEDIRILKCAVEEIQEKAVAPSVEYVYHMSSVFNKGESQ